MQYEIALAIGVVIPLISFVILALFGARIGKPRASYVACAAIGISCLLAIYVLAGWHGETAQARETLTDSAYRFDWGRLGTIPITVGVKLDSLTVIMYFMVTFVSFWIFFFSVGYMEGHSDEVDGRSKYHRFFTYLSLFCFSMLGLVVSSSLLFLFIFWELVGLCSYLLIGFYFDKKFASDAAIKAFVTNRVGDFGFIIGLAMVVLYLGTLDLDEAAKTFAGDFSSGTGIFAASIDLFGWHVSGMALATLMGIGLFCGAMGKSAQFPLQVWLPDAMAGPTPVSALIHAATMVAAGVYLVARIFRLLTPDAQFFVAVIGCITLTITALIAIVQTDIKKVLAYSTLSQLGYMIFGMGVGAWIAALFHLMTHAFFKAMLFLGSGQVIEGCHHEQDIRKMGGLRKKMPVTCWTFFVGVLAIAGFGIPWAHVGLGGYFSKDEILAVAYERAFNLPHDDAQAPAHDEPHASAHEEPRASARAALRTPTAPNPLVRESLLAPTAGGNPFPPPGATHHARQDSTIRLASAAGVSLSQIAIHNSPSAPAMNGLDDAEQGQVEGEHSAARAGAHGSSGHGTAEKDTIAATMQRLPQWMFWLPIIIAYVTPFYMMRCWWLTFCGKPRDPHVYEHAHENWKMFLPLVVLAVGTVFCSYRVFRPLLDDAAAVAADAPAIVAFDGEAANIEEAGKGAMMTLTHGEGLTNFANPHIALGWIVGLAWVVGMGGAWLIYRNGLAGGERWRRRFGFIHRALEQKLYFDHVYDNVLVGGTIVLGYVARLFDTIVVDGLVNLSALFTRAIGIFTGRQLDMPVNRGDVGLVDALANGLASVSLGVGTVVRRPQSGRIRTYVLLAAGSVTAVLLAVLLAGGG